MKAKGEKVRRSVRHAPRWLRTAAYTVVAGGVLALAVYLLVAAFTPPKLVPLAGNVIDVKANMAGFDQREIHVKAGQPVTIRLTSLDNQHHTDGGGKHQWAVDELGVNIVAPSLGSNTATFTPAKAGVYQFYCDICCGGRANPSMQGRLIVEA
jgi:heme/copper-type cytochrome/quinol oxidase subunit 2